MKNVFKPFIPLVLVLGIAAGLLSCLNPLNFNEGESLVTIDVNLSGTLDTNDITSAVLLLSNNSKSVDVTSVVITQPEWQPTKPTDTPPRWAFSGKPKHLEKKAQYLPPSDIAYQVVVSYACNALEGQIAGTGTKTLSVSLPLPKQILELFLYRDKDGKVVVAQEIRAPHPTDTGIPADDPMQGEGSIPAIVPPQNRDKIASFIVVSMTRSQHIDTVNFKASDDRDYTIHGINASDRQSIALGQGAWKTKLVYTREGITNTIGPVNSIIVPSSDPQAVKEHYLYFYLNSLGDYTVSQTWPPVPNDVDENDLLPPDAGFGRSLIKIENKSYALAKSVTVVNERDPDKAPMVIYSDKFTPAVPVEYNKTGYVDVVGSEGFPIHAHEGYLVRVTMEVYGSEPVEIERQAYIKDQIIAITVEQKDLAGTPVPAGANITLENRIEKYPVEIAEVTIRNKADHQQAVTYKYNDPTLFWWPAVLIGQNEDASVTVIDSEKMPITVDAEYEAVVTLYGSGVTRTAIVRINQSEKLWSVLEPEKNFRTITVRDGDVPDEIIEAYYNTKGATFIIKNEVESWPVEITGFKVYNQAVTTEQTAVDWTQNPVGNGGEETETVTGSIAMPIDPGMKFKVDLNVKGNGNNETVTKTINPEELFSEDSVALNIREVMLEDADIEDLTDIQRQQGATFVVKNAVTLWPVTITSIDLYNIANPSEKRNWGCLIQNGIEDDSTTVNSSDAMPIKRGAEFEVKLTVEGGNGATETITKIIDPKELFSDKPIAQNIRKVILEDEDIPDSLKSKPGVTFVIKNGIESWPVEIIRIEVYTRGDAPDYETTRTLSIFNGGNATEVFYSPTDLHIEPGLAYGVRLILEGYNKIPGKAVFTTGPEGRPLELFSLLPAEQNVYTFTVYDSHVADSIKPPKPGPGVYVAGYVMTELGDMACYWVDGVRVDLPLGADWIGSSASSITVSNGNVYVVGTYTYKASNNSNRSAACYWVNGVRKELDIGLSDEFTVTAGIIAVDKGKLYIAGNYSKRNVVNSTGIFYWVDGTPNLIQDASNCAGMAVSDGRVYLTGVTGYGINAFPCYWIDGHETILSYNTKGYARGIAVSNNDVYVVGTPDNSASNNANAGYWLNGTFHTLNTTLSSAWGITISGTTVYILGSSWKDGNINFYAGCYWEDNTRVFLDTGAFTKAVPRDITVSGGKVYITGNYDTTIDLSNAFYWVDGVIHDLDDSPYLGHPVLGVRGTSNNNLFVVE